jgi:hypothetical protein
LDRFDSEFDEQPPPPAEETGGGDYRRSALLCAVLAGVAFYQSRQQGGTWELWAGVLFVAFTAGLWFQHAWARWGCFLAAVAIFAGGCGLLYRDGLTWQAMLMMVFGPAWSWDLLSFQSEEKASSPEA